jgi:DNA-directed RNA polymerase subunit RPC12/RpoP
VATSMDDKPGAVSCPHCGAKVLTAAVGDRRDIDCPTCGIYSISGTQADRFDKGRADPKAAGFVVDVSGRRWLIGIVG